MHAIPNCRFRNYFQLHEIHSRSCTLGFEFWDWNVLNHGRPVVVIQKGLLCLVWEGHYLSHTFQCVRTPFLQLSTDSSLHSTKPTMSSQNPWKALKTPNWHVITTSEIGKKNWMRGEEIVIFLFTLSCLYSYYWYNYMARVIK